MDHGKSTHTPQDPQLERRMRRMFGRDRAMALGMLAGLWLALVYIYFAVPHGFLSSSVGLVLTVSGVLVLAFNSASVFAMLRHYDEDRDHIYGLDIHHLDLHRARARRAALRPAHVDIA